MQSEAHITHEPEEGHLWNVLALPRKSKEGGRMNHYCSDCKCEALFLRPKMKPLEGHRYVWAYLCDECYDNPPQQNLLIEDAPITKPWAAGDGGLNPAVPSTSPTPTPTAAPPPGGPVISHILDELESGIFSLDALRSLLQGIEDYIIDTTPGPSKPAAVQSSSKDPSPGQRKTGVCSSERGQPRAGDPASTDYRAIVDPDEILLGKPPANTQWVSNDTHPTPPHKRQIRGCELD